MDLLHKEVIISQENKQNKLVLLEKKGVEIANNFPGDNNLLLEKQESFSVLRVTLEKAKENQKIKNEF